ncbi:hypothetical protein D3C75_1210390 [compost metagenome]
MAGQRRLDHAETVRPGVAAQGFDSVEADGACQGPRLHLDHQLQVGQAAGV